MMCYVERVEVGRLGASSIAPVVRSARSSQEKKPWKELDSIQHAVEASCLRTAYLGSSIAPFRVLERPEAVIPVEGTTVLDSQRAESRGFPNAADWLRRCETLWDQHSSGRITFREQIDWLGKLNSQFPIAPVRLVYAASGSVAAACVIQDPEAVIEHVLYWAACETLEEAHYLAAILNAEATRVRIEHMQSRGEQGARHFDKLFFTLPNPSFDAAQPLHMHLADAGRQAEVAAAGVFIEPETPFVTARTAVREALREDGTSARIDALVNQLLGDAGLQDRVAPTSDPISFATLAGRS